jgi:hypothetical protein
MKLRERGIYCLLNGRELVVVVPEGKGWVKLRGSEQFEQSEYEVDRKVTEPRRLTAWGIENLTDTGRTA